MSTTTYGTRGVKFKFTEGDRVLCYEPDPTKAKVLYESKVLETVVSRDSRGRKVAEYRVHFQGWNSSWDRCVREDFVLEINPENRLLQKKLAHDAAINLKGRKRKKLPAFFKESMKKGGFDTDDDNDTDDDDSMDSNQDSDDLNQDEDEEEEEEKDGKHVFSEIKLTEKLKEKLEEDCLIITAKYKLVNLPCEPNVIHILERYVKQTAYNLLYTIPMKGNRQSLKGSDTCHSSDIETRLNLCKELVDGVRIFFDFTLPLSLLYREEKQQYETINTLIVNSNPSPISLLPYLQSHKEDSDERNGENKRSRTPGEDSIPWHSFQPLSPTPITPGSSVNSQPSSPSFSNAIFNNGQSGHNSLPAVFFQSNKSAAAGQNANHNRNSVRNLNNGGTSSTLPNANDCVSNNASSPSSPNVSSRTRFSSRSQSLLRDRQSPCSSIEDGTSSKRVLRSSDRQRDKLRLDPPNLVKNDQNSNDASVLDAGLNRSASPPITIKPGNLMIHSNTVIAVVTQTTRACSPPPNTNLQSLSASSSASSTHSDSTLKTGTVNSKLDVFSCPTRIRDPSGLLNEILSWQLLPRSVYETKPVVPSVVYGAQHLLRLFVVLPDYLSRMNMTRRKRNTLVDGLKAFIKYLDDSCGELFPDSATYKDLDELNTAKN